MTVMNGLAQNGFVASYGSAQEATFGRLSGDNVSTPEV